jgi:hypothetical protein
MSHLAFARVLPGILMLFSACLVTSSPTFEEPVRTKPFLDVEGATPTVSRIFTVTPTTPATVFSAPLRSEDLTERVEARVLLNYGRCSNGRPFEAFQEDTSVEASTFDDTDRRAEVQTYFDGAFALPPGCHRLTLMASHAFDPGTGCPADLDDFSQVTWVVFSCETEDCGPVDPDSCPIADVSCEDFSKCLEEP